MDYAPGFNQYQTPEKFTDKVYRAIVERAPYVLNAILNAAWWLIKLIRDFIRDMISSALGR